MIRLSTLILVGILIIQGCNNKKHPRLKFEKLLVEYTENPDNIDQMYPRFSWVVSAAGRDRRQSAFRILVASSVDLLADNKADMWDSEDQVSSETIQHEYQGNDLKSVYKYFWKVIVWDEAGRKYESPVSRFETAILHPEEWIAGWIGAGPEKEPLPEKGFFGINKEQDDLKDTIIHNGRSLLLRKDVSLPGKVRSAKAFITGLGYYEFYINGNRVGHNVLTPAKTPYHRYILYDTYDITDFLTKGRNVFGFHLGNGWYNPYKKWWNQYRMQWFGSKKAMAQIHITYADGSVQVITTGRDWKQADGPVIYNCVYDGEVYDANFVPDGWNNKNYDDSGWNPATVFTTPKARLVSQRMPPIKVNETIKPAEVIVSTPGIRVFDMGQNFAGWVRIRIKGSKNTRLKIRFAEDIHEDGTIDATSNEKAKATAEYIMKGNEPETYEPAFTFFGFRYVEVTSENGPYELLDIEGRVVHSANRRVGQFECGNNLVSKIHHAAVWSQKSNMMGYPMDCPQRDERLGWLGDAQVSAEEAMFNFDMALFYENWLQGIRENQDEKTGDIPIISPQPYMPDEGVEWSSTYIIMLWQYYNWYGDIRILSKHFPALVRYMEFLDNKAESFILPMGWIGDWGSLVNSWKEGQPESVPTAFYYLNARIMSKIAAVLEKEADRQHFTNLSEKIRKTYNSKYLNPETGNYLGGSQMDNAFPLYLGLVPDSLENKVLDNLIHDIAVNNDTHLTTGVLGTKYMPEALAHMDRADVAWAVINQKSPPSWNEMMKKYNTTCEFWTLKQSKNHVMMGSIDAWFYKYLSGIQPVEGYPAFTSFIVKPFMPDGLNYAGAKTETMRGTVASRWKRESGRFTLEIQIPFNTSAQVYIPAEKNSVLTESGIPLNRAEGTEYIGYNKGAHCVKIHSGRYFLECTQNSR